MIHPDLNELLEALVSMAVLLLRKQGEFYPIGAILWSNGELQYIGGKIERDDHPPSQVLLDLLTDTFRASAAEGKLRAAGICFDGLAVPPGKSQKQDTICCGLEHCLGETVNVFRPYAKTDTGDFELEDAFSSQRKAEFFLQLPLA